MWPRPDSTSRSWGDDRQPPSGTILRLTELTCVRLSVPVMPLQWLNASAIFAISSYACWQMLDMWMRRHFSCVMNDKSQLLLHDSTLRNGIRNESLCSLWQIFMTLKFLHWKMLFSTMYIMFFFSLPVVYYKWSHYFVNCCNHYEPW